MMNPGEKLVVSLNGRDLLYMPHEEVNTDFGRTMICGQDELPVLRMILERALSFVDRQQKARN